MAKIELNPTEIFLIGAVWAALWAGAGWLANHKLSAARDRRARKYALDDAQNERRRDFRAFMSGFRSWMERSTLENLGSEFSSKVHTLREQTAGIRDDIPENKRAQFDEVVTNLCRMTARDVSEYQRDYSGQGTRTVQVGRNRLATAIDAVSAMLE